MLYEVGTKTARAYTVPGTTSSAGSGGPGACAGGGLFFGRPRTACVSFAIVAARKSVWHA